MLSNLLSRENLLHEQYSQLRRRLTTRASNNVVTTNNASDAAKQQTNLYDSLHAFWQYVRLQHYRFEVTYSAYVMDPAEKVAFYGIVLLFVVAMLALLYYPLLYLLRIIDPRPYISLAEVVAKKVVLCLVDDGGYVQDAGVGGVNNVSSSLAQLL
jgi:hypothetical protein